VALLLLLLAAPIAAREAMSPWIELRKGYLRVGTSWHATAVPTREIDDVRLLSELPRRLRRLDRYALGANAPGRFLVEDLGEVEWVLSTEQPPYLLLRSSRGTLLINAEDAERTERLSRVFDPL